MAAWPYLQHEVEPWRHCSPPVSSASSSVDEWAYVNRMQRSLALLRDSVQRGSSSSPQPTSTNNSEDDSRESLVAAAQAALVIEAMTNGNLDEHLVLNRARPSAHSPTDIPSVPVSALFKTIRKQRPQARHHCSECGITSTSQWRNSPTGQKLCNPCGMKLWRRKKQDPAKKPSEPQQEQPQHQHAISLPDGGVLRVEEVDKETSGKDGRRRSNIYNLLN